MGTGGERAEDVPNRWVERDADELEHGIGGTQLISLREESQIIDDSSMIDQHAFGSPC